MIMTTMLRHNEMKLIVWHGDPACGNARDGELYDLSSDPGELRNLFHLPEYADQRRKMKARLLDVMAAAEDRTEPRLRNW